MSRPSPPIASAVQQRILPLQFSPLEKMMLADDRAAYPMTFFVQLGLLGQVSLDAFTAATHEALDRHPLLRTFIAPHKANRLCWVEAADPKPVLDWASEDTPIRCDCEAMDRTKEIGVRLWIRQGPQRATVLLQFHHANCDGTGAYRFIGDLLAGYGIRTSSGDNRPTLGDIDPRLLRNRTRHTINLAIGPERGFKRSAIREGWRVVSRRPARLAPPLGRMPGAGCAQPFPGFVVFSFDRDQHRQLRDIASRCGVFLNDLLLRDLFLTMARWNERQQGAQRRRALCIMMPTDLRTGEDYLMPSANMTSCTFLCRDLKRFRSPEVLLESIRQETAAIKHQRSATAWSDMAYAAAKVPGLLPFLMGRNLCFATAILSNAADPSRRFTATFSRKDRRIVCGDTILEEITGVPPLRRNTRATFSISQYDARLTISLRCDPHLFRLEDTTALLQMYTQQLEASADIKACPHD